MTPNLNAYVRLVLAGLLGACGIGLMVYSAILTANGQATAKDVFVTGSAMLAGSGLTAWDAHIA